jgi:hypothetical protein
MTGGFPDEVLLGPVAEAAAMAEGVPRALKLKAGLEQVPNLRSPEPTHTVEQDHTLPCCSLASLIFVIG